MTKIVITQAMQEVVDHFGELGPRWGLRSDVTRAHALLFLVGRALSVGELSQHMDFDKEVAESVIEELRDWRMVSVTGTGVVCCSEEPWDLLFAAMEERRRREVEPALKALERASASASNDGTPSRTAQRIDELFELVQDLATLGARVDTFSSRSLTRFTRVGSRLSRVFRITKDQRFT